MTNSTLHRNKQQVASQFNRAALTYDNAARIQQLSADVLTKRLRIVQDTEPSSITGSWLDLGCGTGFSVPTLIQQGAQHIIGADLAHTMSLTSKEKLTELPFHSVTCDAEHLPFCDHIFDGIYSNLMIQWSEELGDLFCEAQRVLKSEGLFAFATLGPKTMLELKNAWEQVDPFTHVNTFKNTDELLYLCEQYFDIESIHQEAVIQQHSSLKSLLKELKAIGATNVNSGRRPGLGGRERLKKLEQAYRQQSENDYLPLTYDLIWVVARKRSDA